MLTNFLLSFFGAVSWYQLFTSAGHMYPVLQPHTETVVVLLLLILNLILSALSSFTLLFAPSPHRLNIFIISSACLRRVISHLNHKNLSVKSKRQRLLTKLNHHISAAVINIIFTSFTHFAWLKSSVNQSATWQCERFFSTQSRFFA